MDVINMWKKFLVSALLFSLPVVCFSYVHFETDPSVNSNFIALEIHNDTHFKIFVDVKKINNKMILRGNFGGAINSGQTSPTAYLYSNDYGGGMVDFRVSRTIQAGGNSNLLNKVSAMDINDYTDSDGVYFKVSLPGMPSNIVGQRDTLSSTLLNSHFAHMYATVKETAPNSLIYVITISKFNPLTPVGSYTKSCPIHKFIKSTKFPGYDTLSAQCYLNGHSGALGPTTSITMTPAMWQNVANLEKISGYDISSVHDNLMITDYTPNGDWYQKFYGAQFRPSSMQPNEYTLSAHDYGSLKSAVTLPMSYWNDGVDLDYQDNSLVITKLHGFNIGGYMPSGGWYASCNYSHLSMLNTNPESMSLSAKCNVNSSTHYSVIDIANGFLKQNYGIENISGNLVFNAPGGTYKSQCHDIIFMSSSHYFGDYTLAARCKSGDANNYSNAITSVTLTPAMWLNIINHGLNIQDANDDLLVTDYTPTVVNQGNASTGPSNWGNIFGMYGSTFHPSTFSPNNTNYTLQASYMGYYHPHVWSSKPISMHDWNVGVVCNYTSLSDQGGTTCKLDPGV